MSSMKSLGEKGLINALLVPFVLTVLLFCGALVFGLWAFSSRQDYKNNSDKKVAVAVSAAESKTQAADAKQYAAEAKNPLKKYIGPAAFGGVSISFPKTWSSYIVQNSGVPLDGFFQPDFVPDVAANSSVYALRVQILQESYDQAVQDYTGFIQQKTATLAPYSLPKVGNVIGSRIDGTISTNTQGSVVILPLRNLTLKLTTQSTSYLSDFNNIILPNATFNP